MKIIRVVTFVFAGILLFSACASSVPEEQAEIITQFEGQTVYTAYNIWYEPGKENTLWCINYKTGDYIPAGTEVNEVALSRAVAGRKAGAEPLSVSFVTVDDGKKYWVNINQKFHPGKTIHDYIDLMFTEKTFDELTAGFNEEEIGAIREGVVKVGMSKEAVLVAYGYPPEHKTPDLESNEWIYWINRFRSKTINFDENGQTYKPKKDPDVL